MVKPEMQMMPPYMGQPPRMMPQYMGFPYPLLGKTPL